MARTTQTEALKIAREAVKERYGDTRLREFRTYLIPPYNAVWLVILMKQKDGKPYKMYEVKIPKNTTTVTSISVHKFD